jgi:hypothetical protein
MTAKEKAKELVSKMYIEYKPSEDDASGVYVFYMNLEIAKRCALIAVDEIIKELKSIRINLAPCSYVSYQDYKRDLDGIQQDAIAKLLFLDEVKQQIQAL